MNAIEINKGECLRAEIVWSDDAGPIDLTGHTISIVEAVPDALTAGTVDITDAAAGKATIRIEAATAAAMRAGRASWIRLGRTQPDGCLDTTPQIWICVR